MNVILYCRVSTNHQDFDRQIEALKTFVTQRGDTIVNTFAEIISGAKKTTTDKMFVEMLNYCKTNGIKKVYTTELSRLGRTQIEILKTMDILEKERICVHTQTFNLETIFADGTTNYIAKMFIGFFSSIIEMERGTLAERLRTGYVHARKNGTKVGRKKNAIKLPFNFLKENEQAVKLLREGMTVRNVAKLTAVSKGTVMKVKGLLEKKGTPSPAPSHAPQQSLLV